MESRGIAIFIELAERKESFALLAGGSLPRISYSSGILELTLTDGIAVETFEVVPYPVVSAEVIPFLKKTAPPLR
jgi:hypothetical protein